LPGESEDEADPAADARRKDPEDKPVAKDDPETDKQRRTERRGSGAITPSAPAACSGVLSAFLWTFLGALLLAVIVAALVLFLRNARAPPPASAAVGRSDPSVESVLTQPDRYSVEALWRQADELARGGHFLEAVRHLYLAVLALLHRRNLIRFERMRTN